MNETEDRKQEIKVEEESNLIKALDEAIEEFLKDIKNAEEAQQQKRKRVIVIFTSKFNIKHHNVEKVNKTIRKLHALKISLIIFGYQINVPPI